MEGERGEREGKREEDSDRVGGWRDRWGGEIEGGRREE